MSAIAVGSVVSAWSADAWPTTWRLAVASLAPLLTLIALVQLRSPELPLWLQVELFVAEPKFNVFAWIAVLHDKSPKASAVARNRIRISPSEVSCSGPSQIQEQRDPALVFEMSEAARE